MIISVIHQLSVTAVGYGVADNLAFLFALDTWTTVKVEKTTTLDMLRISCYIKKWKLKLSLAKTTATASTLILRERIADHSCLTISFFLIILTQYN